MAEPTNELILRTLQQIQETLADHSRQNEVHTRRFDRVEQTLGELTASIATALGFAMHANLRHESVSDRLAELDRKVGTLDDLRNRVEVLERTK